MNILIIWLTCPGSEPYHRLIIKYDHIIQRRTAAAMYKVFMIGMSTSIKYIIYL